MFIIAGIGLNSFDKNKIKKIILAGADILRYNFSYKSIEENIELIKMAREVIDELHANTKILVDFPLSKGRLGDFNMKLFAVREGEELVLKSSPYSPDCNKYIPVQIPKLGEKVNLNQTITIGDGEVAIQVLNILDSDTIKVMALNNGTLQYMKTFNIRHRKEVGELMIEYQKIIEQLSGIETDFIALSYIDKVTNEKIKKLSINKAHKIIIKIENQTGIDDIESIFKDPYYNMVMLDRGEMGVNTPFEKLGLIEKKMAKIASRYQKPIVFSTQILESAIHNYIPNRSDILGLTSMVLDGVAGIMLCQETTVGLRPAYSVNTAKKIIDEVSRYTSSINSNVN